MSTTLTNGLKLPDKGSVDWYADMQNNYTILDGAVGTIAEHTTALAGKAPLVHTHTKSDVTDLFNSANVWSENQTYSKTTISNAAEVLHCKNANIALGETPASDYQKLFMFKDKNNDNFGYYRHLYQTTGSSQFDILVRNKFTNGAPDTSGSIDYLSFSLRLNADKSKEGVLMGSFKPSNTNTYDLGSSSYQWNNLYAKNYYYNGVAWGLDKANVWTGANLFTDNININKSRLSGIRLYNNDVDVTANSGQPDMTVSDSQSFISFKTKYQQNSALLDFTVLPTSTYTKLRFATRYHTNSSSFNSVVIDSTVDSSNNKSFAPATNNDVNLGTPTNRWKSLNGTNPGALSLPDTLGTSGTENVNYFNVIGYLNNTGTLTTIPSTATYDGWLYINAKDGADSYIIIDDSPASFGTSVFGNNGLGSQSIGLLCLMCPIRKGHAYNVRIKSAGIVSARIYPAQGNV